MVSSINNNSAAFPVTAVPDKTPATGGDSGVSETALATAMNASPYVDNIDQEAILSTSGERRLARDTRGLSDTTDPAPEVSESSTSDDGAETSVDPEITNATIVAKTVQPANKDFEPFTLPEKRPWRTA